MIRSEGRRVFCLIRPGDVDDRRAERYSEDTLLAVGGKLIKDEEHDGYIWLKITRWITARGARNWSRRGA